MRSSCAERGALSTEPLTDAGVDAAILALAADVEHDTTDHDHMTPGDRLGLWYTPEPITALNVRLTAAEHSPTESIVLWCTGELARFQVLATRAELGSFDPATDGKAASLTLSIERGREHEATHTLISIMREGDTLEDAEQLMRVELRALADLFATLAAVRT